MHGDDKDQTELEAVTGIDSRESIPEALLELEYVFESIAESRRRYLLYTLGAKEAWTITELATKVRAWELGIPESGVSEREVELAYASLYHSHIPKLLDHEVIEYDEKSETITPGRNTVQVLAVLAGAGASLDTNQERHARSEMDDENN